MQIIPVLDLSNGRAVHAKKGIRKHYRPIQSPLCPSSHPVEIVHSLLELSCFRTLYIADIDAIEQHGNNADIVKEICLEWPELEIWLDTGLSLISYYLKRPKFRLLRIILSTESMHTVSTLNTLKNHYPDHRFILSVDYKSQSMLGPQEFMHERGFWPSDVVVLNLDLVGTCSGINFPDMVNQQILFNSHNIYYGGGIRNHADLLELENLGAAGALLSTALHEQTITQSELLSFSQ